MSEQLDFALNLVNEFSGPAEAGAKSALALAGAILQAERAEQSFQRALDKEDRVGALAARLSKATAEQKIASLNAPAAARPGMSAGVAERVGALTGGRDVSAAQLGQARALLSVEGAQRALNKAQSEGDPLRILQATMGLRGAQDALRATTGETGKTFGDLGNVIGEVAAGPLGMFVKAAATGAAALVGLTAAGFAFVLSQADAKRNLQLTLEAMLGGEDAGIAMEEQFQNLAKTLPITRDHLDDMGKSLITAGLRGDTLIATISALSSVESTMGAAGAGKLQNMIEKWNIVGHFEAPPAKALLGTGVTLDLLYTTLAAKTGQGVEQIKALMKAGKITTEQGVDALNEVIGSKLGNVAAQKLLGLGVQFQKFKENVGNLFEDAMGDNFEKFLSGVHDLFFLFDTDSESGKTLKFLLDQLFSTIGDGATGALPLLKSAFQGLEIGILEAMITMKPVIRDIQDFLGTPPGDEQTSVWERIGEVIGYTTAGVLLLTRAWGSMIDIAFAPFQPMIDLVFFVRQGLLDLVNWVLDFDVGRQIIDGIVGGISAGASRVWDALTGLGTGSKTAMAESIDAHSPSEDFKRFGLFMAQGTAMGVDMGAQGVNDSVSSMVAPPSVASAGGGGGPVSVVLNFEVGPGAKASDAEAIADVVLARVTSAFENAGLSLGESAAA